MSIFSVSVRYQTTTGCNTKLFPRIKACDFTDAIEIATAKMRKRHGVIKIDGGDVVRVAA